MALRRLIDSERESEGTKLDNEVRNISQNLNKPKAVSAYTKRYQRAFRKIAPSYKLKSGKWKKGGFKRAVRAAHKEAKK